MSVTTTLVAFSLTALLLTLTPGLDTALVLRTTIVEGKKSALKAALGINFGCYLWGAAVALGLGALLAASQIAYDCLKWIGAGYLLYLALQMLMARPQPITLQITNEASSKNWFVRGCLGNALNPKVGIFYVSFLPQFIPAGHSPILWTFLLVSIHVALGTLWSLILINVAGRAAHWLQDITVLRWINRVTAGFFTLFAAKLVFSSH